MSHRDDSSRPNNVAILVGLVLIFAGLTVLVDRVGLSGLHVSGRSWPLLLILYGGVRWLTAVEDPVRRRHSRWTAAWFIYLGLWFFINEFHVLGLWYDTSWPLLMVWAGMRMTWCAIEKAHRGSAQRIEES